MFSVGYAMLIESHHTPAAVRLLVAVCLIAGYCSGEYMDILFIIKISNFSKTMLLLKG